MLSLSLIHISLIFKSVDASGSRGITRVDSYEECDSAIQYVKENTRKDYFLIEEFVEGEEFGAQAFVYNGEMCIRDSDNTGGHSKYETPFHSKVGSF